LESLLNAMLIKDTPDLSGLSHIELIDFVPRLFLVK